MPQLTIRFDEALARHLRRLARSEGLSLNQVAVRLVRLGLERGAADERAGPIGDALNDCIGTWTPAQARAFRKAVAPFERPDEELWR